MEKVAPRNLELCMSQTVPPKYLKAVAVEGTGQTDLGLTPLEKTLFYGGPHNVAFRGHNYLSVQEEDRASVVDNHAQRHLTYIRGEQIKP